MIHAGRSLEWKVPLVLWGAPPTTLGGPGPCVALALVF